MGKSSLTENLEVFDVGSVSNGNSQMGSSFLDPKVECLDSLITDFNGSDSMVVEEQCDDKKVGEILLKTNRNKEKDGTLKKDLSTEISSVNNESLDFAASIPEMQSKVFVEAESVSLDMISSSSVDVEPCRDDTLIQSVEKDNVLQSLSLSLERCVIQRSSKKLLILDLNGLLVDFVQHPQCDLRPDIVISGKPVFKRPYYDDFLKFCFDRFNVGIWSSRNRRNMEMVIDFLMRDSKHKLLFSWDQSHCTETGFTTLENKHKPLVLKELRKLWENIDNTLPWNKGEFDGSNTLLLDDSPYKALCNPAYTAIFPYSYDYRDHGDSSLGAGGDLRMYLARLADAENVRKFVAENPYGQQAITESNAYWSFYRKVKDVVSSRNC